MREPVRFQGWFVRVSLRGLLLSTLLLLMASTCGGELSNREVIGAKNDSPERQDVEVFYLVDGEEQTLGLINPGGSIRLREAITGQCTEGVLIARHLGGEEVERRGPGLCVGTLWAINGDPSD